jgi:CRP-like cAMP-binding protein
MLAHRATLPATGDGIFATLDPHLKPRLDAVRHVHQFPRAHVFCVEGDPATAVTAILEGSVKLTRAGERGDPQVLRLLGPGDVFGLRPLLAGDTFAAAALALEPVRVATYPGDVVRELLQESPAFAMAALTRLARELRYSEDMLMVLTQRPVKRRIADVLLLLHGRRIDGENWAPFPPVRLKRKEIAQMVGTTPETLSRTLAEFAAAGLIRVDRRRVTIRDEAGLQKVERDAARGRA